MRYLLLISCAAAALVASSASGNEQLQKMSQNPKDWVMPTGDYANTRYSQLKQITADNVGKLQVAWTFSTGVLRGHEGGPLIIGDVMYVHGPFPNPVFALDLNNDGKILWKYEPRQDPNVIPVMCCDTVNRGLACFGIALLLTGWVAVRLWPDFHQWQGTPLLWLVALGLDTLNRSPQDRAPVEGDRLVRRGIDRVADAERGSVAPGSHT